MTDAEINASKKPVTPEDVKALVEEARKAREIWAGGDYYGILYGRLATALERVARERDTSELRLKAHKTLNASLQAQLEGARKAPA